MVEDIVVIGVVLTCGVTVASVAGHPEGTAGDKAAIGRLLERWVDLEAEVTQAVVSDSEDPGLEEG